MLRPVISEDELTWAAMAPLSLRWFVGVAELVELEAPEGGSGFILTVEVVVW